MATLSGTLKSLNGAALTTALVFSTRAAPAKAANYVISAGARTVSSDSNGNFSIVLEEGPYEVTWKDGQITNRGYVTIAPGAGAVRFEVLLLTEGGEIATDSLTAVYSAIAAAVAQSVPRTFDTITEMLAIDDGVWKQATTLNAYTSGDGVLHSWIRIPAGTVPTNSDSRLSTRGGTSILLQVT